jgi:ferrous iron transport protein B
MSTIRNRPLVAFVGNPNAGKTTLFNGLTGSRQKVANYPGVTVERLTGVMRLGAQAIECVDVPGLYSMEPVSEDERVAAAALRDDEPDVVVCVIDATNLERNLFLYTQIAELGRPTVVALTMVDRLAAQGRSLNFAALEAHLGCPVVGVVGHRERGLEELRAAILRTLDDPRWSAPRFDFPAELEERAQELRSLAVSRGANLSLSAVRSAILRPSDASPDLSTLAEELAEARAEALVNGWNGTLDVETRYRWCNQAAKAALPPPSDPKPKRRPSNTERIDKILTHRVFGLIVFVLVMFGVFQSIYSFAAPLMEWIDGGFTALKNLASSGLEGQPVLQSLIADGVIAGIGSAIIFLPQILILFLWIALLEGTGYLARAAFLMDRLLGWCGLNGRAFIPLLSSFACAIPGVMAARVMPDPKSRLATILVAPLMSCSARLPVYLVLIGAFIQPQFGSLWAGVALFGMHMLGLVVAVPVAWILNRKVLKGKRLPFVLELPPYQFPRLKDIVLTLLMRAQVFLKTAGTIIFAMSIVIWALSYFPRLSPVQERQIVAEMRTMDSAITDEDIERKLAEQQLAQSVLGRFGRAIEPVFRPAGFDWRITTAILAAFPAREVVVPSMGVLFSLGGDVDESSSDLRVALAKATWPDGRPLFTPWVAVGLMVFFALCAQCMATFAVVKRESNSWKWPTFMFTYMTALAYLGAVGIHQLGLLLSR